MTLATMRVPALPLKVCAKLMAYLCAFLLVGCVAPQVNPWDSIEVPSEAIETPLPCDELPEPIALDDIGKGRILAMRECAMANYDITIEHITQIEEMRDAAESLIVAGKHQRRIAEMKQEMLDDERKRNFFEKIGLYALILVMGISL